MLSSKPPEFAINQPFATSQRPLLLIADFTEISISLPAIEKHGSPSSVLPFLVVSEFSDRPFTFLIDFVGDSNIPRHATMPTGISFIHVSMPDHTISCAGADPPLIHLRALTTVRDLSVTLRISFLEFPSPVEVMVGNRV
jgi:hypothetical protein